MPRKIGGSLFVEIQEQLLFIACNWSRLHFFNYSSLNNAPALHFRPLLPESWSAV